MVRYKKRYFERKVAKLPSRKGKLLSFPLRVLFFLLIFKCSNLCGFAFII